MRYPLSTTLCAVLTLSACIAASDTPTPRGAAAPSAEALPPSEPARLVVAELFTSEGCSSCPPADALLASLATRPDVLALVFHVDYWDGLGWKDPFSSAWATARQRAYAATLDGRVYTPELVVGGAAGFVGSRRGEATDRIDSAAPMAGSVEVTARRVDRSVSATVAAADAPEGSVVRIALVQRAAETRVARGENGGRTLRHVNVVRAFEALPGTSGTVTLPLPDGLGAADVFVAALVQPGATGPISAAARADVQQPSAASDRP